MRSHHIGTVDIATGVVAAIVAVLGASVAGAGVARDPTATGDIVSAIGLRVAGALEAVGDSDLAVGELIAGASVAGAIVAGATVAGDKVVGAMGPSISMGAMEAGAPVAVLFIGAVETGAALVATGAVTPSDPSEPGFVCTTT